MKITKKDLEQLFSRPLPASRSGAFYNTFPYPTKISPEAIAIYIACVTMPGDTVIDAFAGSGSTGIAAMLCEQPTKKMIELAQQLGVNPVWGKRNSILYEIGTYASFAIKAITNRLTGNQYRQLIGDFFSKASSITEGMYYAKDPDGYTGIIRYAIWSEVLVCANCGEEIEYFQNGVSRNPVEFRKTLECPKCHKSHSIDTLSFAKENYYDRILGKTISRKKRRIVWIYGQTNGKNWDRAATTEDEQLICRIENENDSDFPPREIEWGDLYRSGYHYGISHLHHFYTTRNYCVMSKLWRLAESYSEAEANALRLLLLSYNSTHCTLMTRVVAKRNSKDFVLTGAQSGVLYISKLPVEKNILLGLRRKAKPFEEAYRILENCSGKIEVHNMSSERMIEPDESVSFAFTDPPFGDFIPYAEVNQINELWLSRVTKRLDEVIISQAQNKDVHSYGNMLTRIFNELGRVVKKDGYIAIVFHSAKASVWGAFSDAVTNSGLAIVHSSILDKTQASFKQVVSDSSVQGDPLFLLQKKKNQKSTILSDVQILEQIIKSNPHEADLEIRHCYSLYIGKCMECGVVISMDAKQAYSYIRTLSRDKS
ncbi:MAG: hypothetical protein IJI19_00395 [Ruminococcus sp.]|nr:hypothetical protein [Ruminococcus sp.]